MITGVTGLLFAPHVSVMNIINFFFVHVSMRMFKQEIAAGDISKRKRAVLFGEIEKAMCS
jgi:hypothetical protein